MYLLRVFVRSAIFLVLTIITQIGGIIYLISLALVNRNAHYVKIKRTAVFLSIYLFSTFFVVPFIAPIFGRVKIKENSHLQAHSFLYQLANRNYVKPELNVTLHSISSELAQQHPIIKLTYLDANFPFINGFPLIPHLSHNDGKKIDIAFIYKNQNNKLTDKKPSISGYGVFETTSKHEYDQSVACKSQGYWQYDLAKYLSFGNINENISFSESGTRKIIELILKQKNVDKLFIEPHLKARLQLNSPSVKFHGCHAVRHDDHIHFQIE